MNRPSLLIVLAVSLSTVARSHADVSHWFWHVEVDGQAVDASRPISVSAGDQVEIELLASFHPHRDGFAGAGFAISTGPAFLENGTVRFTPGQGYGLNPYLLDFGSNGALADENNDGRADRIDDVVGFQLHPDWGVVFDDANPISLYRLAWSVAAAPGSPIDLFPAPTLDGHLTASVWQDAFTSIEYSVHTTAVRFVPTPASVLPLLLLASGLRRSRG